MKKGISILLSLLIIIGLFSGLSFPVSASDSKEFTVNALANAIFEPCSKTYYSNGENGFVDTVTVEYYADLSSIDKKLQAAQFRILFDPDVLTIDPDKNGEYKNDDYNCMFPIAKDSGQVNIKESDGLINFAVSNKKGLELRDANGKLLPLVKIVFDIKSGAEGSTNIYYNFYACSFCNAPDTGEDFILYNVNGVNQDVFDNFTSGGARFYAAIDNEVNTNARYSVQGETFSRNLQYYAKHQNSTEYNPELAHLMMTMSNAAYDKEKIEKAYKQLGLFDCIPLNYGKDWNYYGSENSCYSIGSVRDADGICVLVSIRGSGDIMDLGTGTLDWIGNLDTESLGEVHGAPHKNFNNAMLKVYNSLNDYLYDKYRKRIGDDDKNIKFFITGHSRGAAIAQLLELNIIDAMVYHGKENVYGYNFAVPDTCVVGKDSNVKIFNNIFNISNLKDIVSYLPGFTVDVMSSINKIINKGDFNSGWRKWGVSVWFEDGINEAVGGAAHDPDRYLQFMRLRNSISGYTENPKYNIRPEVLPYNPLVPVRFKVYATYCPVDVELVDNNGNVIASVINGVVDYHDSHFGEVIISVKDDHKMFAVPTDVNCSLRIVGKNTGTMDYYVAETDMITEKVSSTKAFENITLEKGKEMTSLVTDYLDASDTQLFLVDNDKNIEQEILDDGTEVNPIFVSESKLELPFGGKATLTAESIDDYRWYSTDESVATVQNGIVTVCGSGEANIIAETVNGAKAICKIQVIDNGIISGTTGDCTWTLDDGTLTISGNGEMADYDDVILHSGPWENNVSSLIIENGVTNIGFAAFYGCTKLTSVSIPDSVKCIAPFSFEGCSNLVSITIPESVTSIGRFAFCECTNLTSINIPDNITVIDNATFRSCNKLENITIPDKVTSIGNSAFQYTGLTSITVPNNVTQIGGSAFSNCENLYDISISDNIVDVGSGAFENTAFYNDENNWENDVLYLNHVLLKAKYQLSGSYQVKTGTTVIADYAFMGSSLEHITLPDSVVSIGQSAFSFCLYCKSVNIPNSVTKIGSCAFERTSIKSVVIPESITTIEGGTFTDSYITDLYIPRSIKTIKNAFYAAEWAQYTQELIKNVYYSGSKNEWNDIDIYESNTSLFLASIHYDISACSITLNQDKYTFTGEEIRPEIIVKDGTSTLINGTDYSITYPNAVDKGTYLVTITGKGDYFGSASISFSIEKSTEIGDINGDNSIDVLDATLIQKYSVDKIILTDEQKELADVNNDGVVDILDATLIQKYAVDKITEFQKS